jgi:hypothetical protein
MNKHKAAKMVEKFTSALGFICGPSSFSWFVLLRFELDRERRLESLE